MKTHVLLAFVAAASGLFGQDAERLVIPFSGSGNQRLVKVDFFHGHLNVRQHDGREVILVGPGPEQVRPPDASGMRRIPTRGGFEAEEENGVISIRVTPQSKSGDWALQVPRGTALQIRTTNARQIAVEGVDGDVDINSVNGSIRLTNVAGSVLAHSVNGSLTATLAQVRQGKPASFSTVNGAIDVTLPADTKANWKLRTENGSIYTDFDVALGSGPSASVEAGGEKGKYRVRADRHVYATVNGGGTEMSFNTLNGRITVRKQK